MDTKMRTFDWIMLALAIGSIIFGIFSVFALWDASNQLAQAKEDINKNGLLNKNEILLAVYEVNTVGMTDTLRNNYFLTRFGFTYDQASRMLEYLNKSDDYSLGISSLTHGDFNTSLNHFDLALIKNPSSIESKIGKSAALIGLNKTSDARLILLEIEPLYTNKAFIEKLLGDSYYNEADFENATAHYMNALGLYMTATGPKDLTTINIFVRVCEMKVKGLFNSSEVSIENQTDDWKIGEVRLTEYHIAIQSLYQSTETGGIKVDWILVRNYVFPEPHIVSIGQETNWTLT
ncbi:MAG: hypothetical protein ABSE07_04220 [Methanoregula sp.]|jgi:tetratricopeptide (TPR) repeat protein